MLELGGADPCGQAWPDLIAVPDRRRVAALTDRATRGHACELEFVTGSHDPRILAASLIPVPGRDAAIERVIVLLQDVTARKQAEAERLKLEAQLLHAQKMEALGQLAGGVAHDFNNLLTAVLGNTETLMVILDDPAGEDPSAALRNGLEQIMLAGERAASLTRQLLAFSRKQVGRSEIVDPNELVTRMHDLLHRLIGERYSLELDLEADLDRVRVHSGMIEQVIMNLVLNARDALPAGGEITVRTRNVHDDAQAGTPMVTIAVIDRGIGMAPETVERIFDPFFTTKPAGKGTGLGLSTAYGAVTQDGGRITVDSSAGVGATFVVHLPAVQPQSEHVLVDDPVDAEVSRSRTVLVCDDDALVRRVVCVTLRTGGYNVIEASGAREALDLVELSDEPIDLVITDVVMPDMNGPQLAERLSANRPQISVLFITGFISELEDIQVLRHSPHSVLEKPFGPATLLDRVRSLLSPA